MIIYCSWSSESGGKEGNFYEGSSSTSEREETGGEEYLGKRSEMSYKVGNIKGVMLGDNLRR